MGVSSEITSKEDELPLWMSVIKDDIDVLVTQFQQQMYTGFSIMMSEVVALYNKNDNEVSNDEEDDGSQIQMSYKNRH